MDRLKEFIDELCEVTPKLTKLALEIGTLLAVIKMIAESLR